MRMLDLVGSCGWSGVLVCSPCCFAVAGSEWGRACGRPRAVRGVWLGRWRLPVGAGCRARCARALITWLLWPRVGMPCWWPCCSVCRDASGVLLLVRRAAQPTLLGAVVWFAVFYLHFGRVGVQVEPGGPVKCSCL